MASYSQLPMRAVALSSMPAWSMRRAPATRMAWVTFLMTMSSEAAGQLVIGDASVVRLAAPQRRGVEVVAVRVHGRERLELDGEAVHQVPAQGDVRALLGVSAPDAACARMPAAVV